MLEERIIVEKFLRDVFLSSDTESAMEDIQEGIYSFLTEHAALDDFQKDYLGDG